MAKGKLALFSATLGGGGAERVMTTLANGIHREGYPVDVVLVKKIGCHLSELDPGIQVVDLASRRTLFSLLPLIQYLRRARPAAMLATQGHVNIVAILARMMARVPLRLLAREASTPSAITRDQNGFRTWLALKLLRVFYPLADCIVAPSQGVMNDLTEEMGLPRERVVVIPNPLALALIRQRAAEPPEHPWFEPGNVPVILGVGRLSSQKDFPTLIGAFAKVVSERACRLIILGEGEDRTALHKLVVSLGLSEQVAMPGFVDNPFSYLKHSAVYVLSSPSEGLPNTLLEALAVGTPAVATDCPSGPREILEGGRWGRLVPVADVEAMAEAINAALNGQVAIAPLSVLEDTYGVDQTVKKYLAVLSVPQHECLLMAGG